MKRWNDHMTEKSWGQSPVFHHSMIQGIGLWARLAKLFSGSRKRQAPPLLFEFSWTESDVRSSSGCFSDHYACMGRLGQVYHA
jgi:hypothetical protein